MGSIQPHQKESPRPHGWGLSLAKGNHLMWRFLNQQTRHRRPSARKDWEVGLAHLVQGTSDRTTSRLVGHLTCGGWFTFGGMGLARWRICSNSFLNCSLWASNPLVSNLGGGVTGGMGLNAGGGENGRGVFKLCFILTYCPALRESL